MADPCDNIGNVAKSGAISGGISGIFAGASGAMSAGVTKSVGEPFIANGPKVQIGVNPNTLTPTKNINTLDPRRLADAVKYAGNKPIEVDRLGNVLDGHHRLLDAIRNNRAIDILIRF